MGCRITAEIRKFCQWVRLFCLFVLAFRLWRCTFDQFQSAVRAMAARCKLPFALRPGLSQEDMKRTKRKTKERTREIETRPLALFRRCHERGRGEKQRLFLTIGTQLLPPPFSSSHSLRSWSSHSDTSLLAFSSAGTSLSTSIVERKSSSCRLAAPHIGEDPEVLDLEPALSPPASLPHICLQDLLLGLPFGPCLEEVVPCLCPARAPPALSGGPALRPVQVLPSEAMTCLQLVEP